MNRIEGVKKFRKKPVVIEATQFSYIDGIDGKKTIKFAESIGLSRNKGYSKLWEIETLEGWHIVSNGDWIITGVKGEKYPCKPDIFETTYEPAHQLFEPRPDEGIFCPYCGDYGFDKEGLKYHLTNYCEAYRGTKDV